MGYVKLLIVLSWIPAVFGVINQIKAAKISKVGDGNASAAWRVQNIATFDWTAAYILLTVSMIVFICVKV